MSDDTNETHDADNVPAGVFHLLATEMPVENSLRWTMSTVLIDLFAAFGDIHGAFADFWHGQAKSLAARASLKEALADREIRRRVQQEERIRMQMHTLQDIAALPETGQGDN